jgi:ectoine hydroxylase-related dioxygenase (phytanoyl-CoA dioxygenase family)
LDVSISLTYRDEIHEQGFAVVPAVIDSKQIEGLVSDIEGLDQGDSIRRKGGVFAVRNLLDVCPAVRDLARSASIRKIVSSILGELAFPARGILFDKTPNANWLVPWHQDVTIAVAERNEVEGFGPWSIKVGVTHVQPPASVLEQMLSVRIHLDPCGEENGALKVIPRSHRQGRIPEQEAVRLAAQGDAIVCAVNAGDALLMRPLLLHASSASTNPQHRRVIHLDFAANKLPRPLRWLSESESAESFVLSG